MKLEPLFDVNDVLRSDEHLTVAYLFEIDLPLSDISENGESTAQITEASATPDNNIVVDQVSLPFGIGDVFYMQEPFRIRAWDRYENKVKVEYKDGTVSKPLTFPQITIDTLFAGTVLMSGNVDNSARIKADEKDFKKITKWHPSTDMPKEAMRIIKIVEDVVPTQIKNLTDKQKEMIGRENVDLFSRILELQKKADKDSWVLLVTLGNFKMPEINLW